MNGIELVGIVATLIIILSMCCETQSHLGSVAMRILNLIGSMVFVVYGFLLPAYSTALLNCFLVVINTYHLYRLLQQGGE